MWWHFGPGRISGTRAVWRIHMGRSYGIGIATVSRRLSLMNTSKLLLLRWFINVQAQSRCYKGITAREPWLSMDGVCKETSLGCGTSFEADHCAEMSLPVGQFRLAVFLAIPRLDRLPTRHLAPRWATIRHASGGLQGIPCTMATPCLSPCVVGV
jgi:hypothetical protein